MRRLVGAERSFYAVCKDDAYGIGLMRAAPVLLEAGADALAVTNPLDVVALRSAGVAAPILLYPTHPAPVAVDLADLDATFCVPDLDTLRAFISVRRKIRVFLKVDCGFSRMGLSPQELETAADLLSASSGVSLEGIYSHVAHTDLADQIERQGIRFNHAIAQLEAEGFRDFHKMLASSRVAIASSRYNFNAVNPGRALYGWLEGEYQGRFRSKPVVRELATRVVQVRNVGAGEMPGYLDPQGLPRPLRIAVLSAGFADGLPQLAHGLPVLLHGRRAPVVGFRATEHMMVDVTDILKAAPNDKAVILGEDGDEAISAIEIAGTSRLPLIEIMPRILNRVSRQYG